MQQSLQYISRLLFNSCSLLGASLVTTIKLPTGRVSMNPVVVSIPIFSHLKQTVCYVFNTEIPNADTDRLLLISLFYVHCYLENILMCL